MKIEPIITPRLKLRGFEKDDALWAYSIWNDPDMGEYLPDEAKEGIDYEYIKELEKLGDDEECCYLIPVLKDNLKRVGTCSFMFLENGKVCDIAYCVHRDFQQQGFATEMAKGMIDYAKKHGANKVSIKVSKENVPSNKVAVKCGGKIVEENAYVKKGTGLKMQEYTYEIAI